MYPGKEDLIHIMTFVEAPGVKAAQSHWCVQCAGRRKPSLTTTSKKKNHTNLFCTLISFMLSWLFYFIRYISSEHAVKAASCIHNINGKRCCWHKQQLCQSHLYVKEIPCYQNLRLDPFWNWCQISTSKVPNFKRVLTSSNLYSKTAYMPFRDKNNIVTDPLSHNSVCADQIHL